MSNSFTSSLRAVTAASSLAVISVAAGAPDALPAEHGHGATSGPSCMLRFDEQAEASLADAAAASHARGEGPHRIVLQFFILRRSDGTGGVTDVELFHDMMRDLNHGFRDTPFVFVARPVIRYVNNDDWYTLNTIAEAHALMNTFETPGVANIFFSDQLLFDDFQARGYTSVTSPRGHIYGDVVGLPYNPPFPPHEMGHLFWLWHPYETQHGLECVDGSNCATAGDRVCDTPASPAVHAGNTTATGFYFADDPGPCVGDPPYAPRTDLYMEAGWPPGHAGYLYRNAFTPGQVDRMLNTLFVFSDDLIGPSRPEVLVDCDGDLLDDVDEILAGDEVDLNEDLVLDQCQVFASPGDLLVSGMTSDLTNRPRFFDGTTGEYRGDLWSGASWVHQFRVGPEGDVYMPSLTVIQRMSLTTGRLVDNFIDGRLEGAQVFVDLLWDDAGDLLLLDNVTRDIRRYDGDTGAYLGTFASLAPTGMTSPKYMEYGPDGNIYIVGNGTRGNTIQMVDRTTGASLGSFVSDGAGGLGAGQGLIFHDGYLYVSNGTANSVLRFDALTGEFIDVFVAPASGGLANPHGLAFGPDENLYVASRNTNSVKRYDGATGAYVDDFVMSGAGGPPGSGGVLQPAGILFIPEAVVGVPPADVGVASLRVRGAMPNPFSVSAEVVFDLATPADVSIDVFDVQGKRVAGLAASERLPGGRHRVVWDGATTGGSRAAPGIYFVAVAASGARDVQRVVFTP